MNIKDYEKKALSTAIYPNIGNNIIYPVLGLSEEAGEVAGKIKKIIRDHDGVITGEHINALCKELGDVLWYLAAISYEMGISLDDVAKTNLDKLHSRKKRNRLKGSGDNR